ncbi:MAG: beta-CASP ribonuclease aCPSF1 [Candidatus Micrarchaeia archaeon]
MEEKKQDPIEILTKEMTAELFKTIKSMLPEEAGFVKAEFEGPDIVIYVKEPYAIYKDQDITKNIAASIKRKLIIRTDQSMLLDPKKAEPLIREIIPPEAGLNYIKFSPQFSEVIIESLKPGLVIGKAGANLKEIIKKTYWIPRILRQPTIDSNTIVGLRQLLYNESDSRLKFLSSVGKKINRVIMKSEWLKATALGGFREVGRSSLLLETPHSKIIIDCGLSPEPGIKGLDANIYSDVNKAFPYLDSANISINDIDAVVLTHAHMDHIGFVPYLFKYGYEGPVYCTSPTRDLAALLLTDYTKLVARSGGTPLYDEKDIRKMLLHMIPRDYNEVTTITNEIKLTYHNAGHILGSATVHLHFGDGVYNIVDTGDIKYGATRLFDPADTKYPRIDTMFMESTYGGFNDISDKRQNAEIELMETIKSTIENHGKVLIPVFAVGRSQEIQLVLENYMSNNNRYMFDTPVYLDGMIIEASAIHTAYPEYLKESLKNRILNNKSPFESEIFEVVKGERENLNDKESAIVLASSGMLNGGASVEYFKDFAEDPRNTLIFVGYNSQNSFGRRVQNGLRETVMPNDEGKMTSLKINMAVKTIEGFSGHSDRRELMSFAEHVKPRPSQIFTMHGEESKCEDLARSISKSLHISARAPMNLDTIRLE